MIGCRHCKTLKKKCDEVRPQCTRCADRNEECIYDPIRPRLPSARSRTSEEPMDVETQQAEFSQTSLRSNSQEPQSLDTPTSMHFDRPFTEPSHNEQGLRLLDHFCNVLSHRLVLREADGNPFLGLIVPLSRESASVRDAVYTLASAHLELRGVSDGEDSEYFYGRTVYNLSKTLENGVAKDWNAALATIILLVYYEVVSTTGTPRWHQV